MKDAELLLEAIGEIREDILEEAEVQPKFRGRWSVRNLAAACLALCFLVLPVSAEMTNGYISNLLAPLYGGARTEIVERIGVPLNASVTVGDYTLTADAVIGDRYNIAAVYSLTHVDGEQLPEGLRFDHWSGGGFARGSGGGSLSHRLSEDRKTLYITEQWTSTSRLFWIRRNVTTSFQDLVIWKKGQETDTPVQEGLWELKFTVRYEDATTILPVKDLKVTGTDGADYEIRKLYLSPIGIHMDMLGTPVRDAEHLGILYQGFTAQLLLKNGTYVEIQDANFGGGGKLEGGRFKWRYGAMFEQPIALEEIQAVVVCGTEIPVNEA